jgi:regulator of nonsense transcripts 3
MTEPEFTTILGPDWAVGKGLVDWLSYVPGKISSEYGF